MRVKRASPSAAVVTASHPGGARQDSSLEGSTIADKTISQLTALGAVADLLAGAVFEVQNVGGAAPESRNMTLAQMREMNQVRTSRVSIQATHAKVGTTAGWVVDAANNLGKMATLPLNITAGTLVVPITGLKVGDVITAFHLVGSLQATAGKHTTIIADLRSLTAATAGATDASVGVMAAALDVVTDTIVSVANAVKTGLSHTVAEGKSYYVLITATTANDAACTAELQSVNVTVTEN